MELGIGSEMFDQEEDELRTMVPTEEAEEKEKEAKKIPFICRICAKKGDHWSTARCPFKKLFWEPCRTFTEESFFIPDSMLPRIKRKTNSNSVEVINLPEDVRKSNLRKLFGPFGPIRRIYIPVWKRTGTSICFAYVTFVEKEDGQHAIDTLNGHCYADFNLIVRWFCSDSS